MANIAVVGDRDSIWGFRVLGVEVHPVNNSEEALETLRALCTPEYGAIFITENYARQLGEAIEELEAFIPLYPSIVIIPSHHGSQGLGMQKVKTVVEKALGQAIFKTTEEEDEQKPNS
jgi:V/A-type H+-transporting ATPase subunit F